MSQASRTLRVELPSGPYEIHVGPKILARLGELIAGWTQLSRAVVVTDENVETPHAHQAAASLDEAGAAVDILVVPSGEESKCVQMAETLWERFLELGADRKTLVVAVGGGVIGDLAGFVAATYARGVPLVQVPTTLLAQVDSSVGGKVGVNLPGGKNMVGAFHQPLGVLADTDTLATLPEREYRAGLAEVVKYGVILDADFFAWLEANVAGLSGRDGDILRHVIGRSCELKARVVVADERETRGDRAVLNFGHTFCHAFEALTGYRQLLHGEAVSIGMICAARLAESLGRVGADFTRRLTTLLESLGLPSQTPAVDHYDVVQVMNRDKKVEHGRLRFVLPTRLGHVELVGDVPPDKVRAALG